MIAAIDTTSGKIAWREQRDRGPRSTASPHRSSVNVGDTVCGATEFDKDGGVHAFDAKSGKLRWTYNDNTGNLQQWYVVAGNRLAVMHGKRIYALPAV